MKRLLGATVLVAASGFAVPAISTSASPPETNPIHSHGIHGLPRLHSNQAGPAVAAAIVGNGIDYHGGPVMKGTINAHVIWYGNWTNTVKTGIIAQNCAWHAHSTIGGTDIKHSFVGDPSGTRLDNCAAQQTSARGDSAQPTAALTSRWCRCR